MADNYNNSYSLYFNELEQNGNNFKLKRKKVISSISPIFKSILKQNLNQFPFIFLKGVKYKNI